MNRCSTKNYFCFPHYLGVSPYKQGQENFDVSQALSMLERTHSLKLKFLLLNLYTSQDYMYKYMGTLYFVNVSSSNEANSFIFTLPSGSRGNLSRYKSGSYA